LEKVENIETWVYLFPAIRNCKLWTRMPVILINFRRSRWIRPAASLLVILLGGLVWQTHLWATSHSNLNTRTTELELDVIRESLQAFSADSATAIPQEAVRNLDARVMYNLLSATNAGAFFLEHRQDWDQRRELVDPWGRPYHMELIYPEGETNQNCRILLAEVKIWSAGPNGRDEHGAGDDIISQTVPIRLRK
jgi:hypothetical protein